MARGKKGPGTEAPEGQQPTAEPRQPEDQTPLEYLLQIMRDVNEPKANRLRAAITAAQYIHVKRDDGGKKEERAEKAAEAATGKLAPSAPPKLAVVK